MKYEDFLDQLFMNNIWASVRQCPGMLTNTVAEDVIELTGITTNDLYPYRWIPSKQWSGQINKDEVRDKYLLTTLPIRGGLFIPGTSEPAIVAECADVLLDQDWYNLVTENGIPPVPPILLVNIFYSEIFDLSDQYFPGQTPADLVIASSAVYLPSSTSNRRSKLSKLETYLGRAETATQKKGWVAFEDE